MKRFLYLFLAVIMMVSNIGCKKSSDVTAVTKGLSFTAEITLGQLNISSDAVIKSDGTAEFKIISPEEIKDLCYICNGDSVTLKFNGLEYTIEGNPPEANAIVTVYKVFCLADSFKDSVTSKDGIFTLDFTLNGQNFTMLLGSSGLPIKILSKNADFEVIIKNATII